MTDVHRTPTAPARERVVRRSVELPASAAAVGAALGHPASFRFVTRGVISFGPVRDRRAPWRAGERLEGPLRLLGVPLGRYRIELVELDPAAGVVRSVEGGGLVRRWEHDIHVEPLGPDRCRYTDEVRIDARAATAVVAAFARAFYALRQRRWAELAEVLGATGAGLTAGR